MVHEKCLHPNSWNLWICYLTWWKELCRCDEGSWDGEIILDYLSGSNIITRALLRGNMKIRVRKERYDKRSRDWTDVLWRWRKGPQAKQCRWLLDAKKGQGTNCPSTSPRCAPPYWFQASETISDSWSSELQDNKHVLFWVAGVVVICYSSSRTLIMFSDKTDPDKRKVFHSLN